MALCRGTDASGKLEGKTTGWRRDRQQGAAILVSAPVGFGEVEQRCADCSVCHQLWFPLPADACRLCCSRSDPSLQNKSTIFLAQCCGIRSVCPLIRARLRRVMPRNHHKKNKKNPVAQQLTCGGKWRHPEFLTVV